MSDINAVTRGDMALLPKLAQYTTPDRLPLSFKYDGETYRGIPAVFKPKMKREFIDTNMTRTTITGTDAKGLEIRAEYLEYRDFPVTEWVAYFKNTAAENSAIVSDIKIIDRDFMGENPIFTYGNGDNCNPSGYDFWDFAVTEEKTIYPVDGTPCNGASPFMKLTFADYQIRIGMGWPAMWEASVSPCDGGITYKVGQKRCHMYLKPGEEIRTPRVTLLGNAGDDSHGRNLWRRWYFKHVLPREYGQPLDPKLVLHTWMVDGKPEFTGATEANQISGIDDYLRQDYKPDIWWIDAGWYPCNFDWPCTGDWYENPAHFPNGLGPVGEKCDENDIQLLVWFEPERVRANTELHREHPDWCLKRSDDDGGDFLLNLGDPECCEWTINHIDEIIKRAHIRIYRQDFNYAPLPVWEYNETPDRLGAIENAHVQGYLHYWDELMFRNPNLWIDSCASGGRRNEMETLRRAVPLHYTDVGYGNHPVKQKQHRLMFEWIPYFRAHTMNWDNDEGGYENGGKPVDEFAYQCALAPSVTSMVEHDAPQYQFELARRFDPIWRRAADIMLTGDYYPLTECHCDPKDWYIMQFDDSARRVGFIQIVRNTQVEDGTVVIKPFVNDDAELYEFENMETGEVKNITSFGLNGGFKVELPKRSGMIWFYNY